MADFFIRRPIFASVISIVIVLAGLMALRILPVAQYPEIAPPTVVITASYPGASAETIAKTVAAPIEDQLNGVENLLYFNSSATSDGTLSITATFEVGTEVNQATINVNNRVQAALPRLPDEVRRNGLLVQKKSNDILLVAAIRQTKSAKGLSDAGNMSLLALSNYVSLNVLDELKRIPGVGDAGIIGALDYAMRIWLRPDRMAQLGVSVGDITQALNAQNAQYAAGKIGQEPAPAGQSLVYTVTARGRLVEPEAFGDIVIRADAAKGILRLRDVARIELGAQQYNANTWLDGQPNISIRVFLQSGANALQVANAVRAKLEALKPRLPPNTEALIPFDTTRFVTASINEVIETLVIAALLVVAVVFVFLHNWRATLIPMIAVPISLIGTFAGLWVLGFTLNTLTLFALVLAIGIVVDDAIVVLENVERLMHEQHLSPYDAAVQAMREVSGAVVAIVLVLCAVFIPVAFLGGIAGRLYQQFAVTVSLSVVISGIVALTLTPALCALLLKPHVSDRVTSSDTHRGLGRRLGDGFSQGFNRSFSYLTDAYMLVVNQLLTHRWIAGLLCVLMLGAGAWLVVHVPTSFVPAEDQGYLVASMNLPDASSLQRSQLLGQTVQQRIADNPTLSRNIEHVFTLNGVDILGGGNKTNTSSAFITLEPWATRPLTSEALVKDIMKLGSQLREGVLNVVNPAPIRGLGSAGGFELYVQDRVGGDPKALAQVVTQLIATLQDEPLVTNVRTFFRSNTPQTLLEVDEVKALSLGVSLPELYSTIQTMMGGLYVNDFNKFGRTYRVQLQADADYRATPNDINGLYVRSQTGDMIALGSLITLKPQVGAEQLERFNGFLSAKVTGSAAPNASSGDIIRRLEQIAQRTLPEGYALEWTGQAFQEKRSGKAAVFALGFAMLMVFLILAAQYEKWSLPIAVLLSIPFALVGALAAVWWRMMPNDIYFQIGLVTLIGLAAKNAILIVEFANQKYAEGMTALEAAQTAARLRFRPIVMTSLAFILGVLPLVFASGAGAAARRSMGTGVLGGMLAATLVATLFVPLFFTWCTAARK
jgi:hydrophobe/amphiphile efflux-1 (HAE1) family protein